MVRLGALDTWVRLADREGALAGISLSGALLELDGPLDVGTEAMLRVRKGAGGLDLRVRVVRQADPRPRARMPAGLAWPVGVAFVDISPAERKAIPRLLDC